MAQAVLIRLAPSYDLLQLETLKKKLGKNLQKAESVTIDAQDLTEIDLSLMQMLITFAFDCEQLGKQLFIVNASSQHPLRAFADKIGFSRFRFLDTPEAKQNNKKGGL